MFTSQSIIQNNSVPSASRGSFNGFTMSISGIGKVVGPAGGAPLLAWSLTNGLPFPLDHTLCYVSATATATICRRPSVLRRLLLAGRTYARRWRRWRWR